ncbi:DUF3489 domain-containing protein [Ruegeria faecimaris]|uniref:DUF3489 domain-containing protein n=1 Tax=Ruegeria faecimaris TaxID=686389 RepID=UPI00232B03D6|nr:DUF3489 domain-containing protein [Ruegeria faecimaris]
MSKSKQSKIDKLQALLRRPSGTSLEALCKATGWQPHSVRAALSGLRKKASQLKGGHPTNQMDHPRIT